MSDKKRRNLRRILRHARLCRYLRTVLPDPGEAKAELDAAIERAEAAEAQRDRFLDEICEQIKKRWRMWDKVIEQEATIERLESQLTEVRHAREHEPNALDRPQLERYNDEKN